MKAIKKTFNFYVVKSVIRDEANPMQNNPLADITLVKKPKSDKSAKKIVIETLGIEPDFENAIMIIDIAPVTKTYEMDIQSFINNAVEVQENTDETPVNE